MFRVSLAFGILGGIFLILLSAFQTTNDTLRTAHIVFTALFYAFALIAVCLNYAAIFRYFSNRRVQNVIPVNQQVVVNHIGGQDDGGINIQRHQFENPQFEPDDRNQVHLIYMVFSKMKTII